MDFPSRRTWVIMAVVIIIVLVIGALIWCYTNRQTHEAFSSMRSSNIQTACRIHKVFMPNSNDTDIHPLYTLQVINRVTGETKVVGPTTNKYKRRIGHKLHLHSYTEAKVACTRNSRFAGFVLITPDAKTHPELITNPNQGNMRYPTLFFEAADESKLTNIIHDTYINETAALRQHVYKLYPQLDKCKDDYFCRFPFLKDATKLGLKEIAEDLSIAKTSLVAAQRYCSAIRQNDPSSKLVGFTCEREGSKVVQFYECQDDAIDYHFEDKWMELENVKKKSIHESHVFFSYSVEPCRETVADDDYMVQLREWTREWESEDGKIHPMLSETEIRNKRICKDNAAEGKSDTKCFLNATDTKIVINKLKNGENHAHKAAYLALDAPELNDEIDPYKIYKDANNKLYFRQRDRCCENRIGHSDTIPKGASERVHELVSASTGCNTDLYSDSFFNDQCNAVCKAKVGEDTPVYRKDHGRCVPDKHKCLPNRTVCNDPVLRAQFNTECPDECSRTCGKSEIDKDRGFKRLYHHPKSAGEDGEQIDVISQHPNHSLDRCQARCDADEECDMFMISPCSTSSDDCWGVCTLQKRQNKTEGAGEVKLSKDKIEPRTRLYAKSGYNIEDPHVSDFYKRNNYCRLDGQPYYQYVMGGDYSNLVKLPERAKTVSPTATGQIEGSTTYQPETQIKTWYGEDAMYSTEDGSKIKLDSFFPALLQGKTTTGETIYFRNDEKVKSSKDGILRSSVGLRYDDGIQITEKEIRIMIKDELSTDTAIKDYTITVESIPPDTINKFKCTVDINVEDSKDTSNEQTMLTKVIDAIEKVPQFTIEYTSEPSYVSDMLERNQMEIRGNSLDKFTISREQIMATSHMADSEEFEVVFNNVKGLSGKGQAHEIQFNVNISDYAYDPSKETVEDIAAKHLISVSELKNLNNNGQMDSPLKVPDTRSKVFVDLELKPFSNVFHFYNGLSFPLQLNNQYINLKSGTYTLRLSSTQNEPVILLKQDGSSEEHKWFFTNDGSTNLFYDLEEIAKTFFDNISLYFRVQDLSAGQSINISSIPTKSL